MGVEARRRRAGQLVVRDQRDRPSRRMGLLGDRNERTRVLALRFPGDPKAQDTVRGLRARGERRRGRRTVRDGVVGRARQAKAGNRQLLHHQGAVATMLIQRRATDRSRSHAVADDENDVFRPRAVRQPRQVRRARRRRAERPRKLGLRSQPANLRAAADRRGDDHPRRLSRRLERDRLELPAGIEVKAREEQRNLRMAVVRRPGANGVLAIPTARPVGHVTSRPNMKLALDAVGILERDRRHHAALLGIAPAGNRVQQVKAAAGNAVQRLQFGLLTALPPEHKARARGRIGTGRNRKPNAGKLLRPRRQHPKVVRTEIQPAALTVRSLVIKPRGVRNRAQLERTKTRRQRRRRTAAPERKQSHQDDAAGRPRARLSFRLFHRSLYFTHFTVENPRPPATPYTPAPTAYTRRIPTTRSVAPGLT